LNKARMAKHCGVE